MNTYQKYIKELQSLPLTEITEHTHRSDLQNLLVEISSQIDKNIQIIHEPKRKKDYGAPDFKIIKHDSIIGYIENKKIGENLDEILKSEQLKRYRELSKNILLTNYLDWVLIKSDSMIRESLCFPTDLDNKKLKLDISKVNSIESIIQTFFSEPPIGISKPKDLANSLAIRSKNLNLFLFDELLRQEKEHQEGKLWGLFLEFQKNVFPELKIKDFSDAFAQMLSYGLFLAILNSDGDKITLKNAKYFIPNSFELIKELVAFLDELERDEYKESRWIIEEIINVLNNLDLESLYQTLTYRKYNQRSHDDLFYKDPYVYFYEDFLSAYDKNMKKSKGVYYTPPPVVSFIINGISYFIENIFNIKEGLSDRRRITLLDFATGTGTFIVEVFQNIFSKLPKSSGKRDLIIKEHLLKNIYGFEYLIAPYTISHLKLSQFLKENGYIFENDERLQIYLTNTLEPIDPQGNFFLPALSKEGELSQSVKEKPILIITGNPPYFGESSNPSIRYILKDKKRKKIKTWIGKLLENYFTLDGKPLKEKNSKWLHDDYVKFIRFAEWKMHEVDEGIVGIITNHSYLDNPTFRGMRRSLMNTFDQIYVLDLHGNVSKKETCPDGSKDENVFDIEQGVCISFFLKNKNLPKKLYHSDIFGTREEKYIRCFENTITNITWNELKPISPFYLFIPQEEILRNQYNTYYSIKDIFVTGGTGIVTKRDNLTIHFTEKESLNSVNDFFNLSEDELRRKYGLPEDVRDWKYEWAKKDLTDTGINSNNVKTIIYRPFDFRKIYYTGNSRGYVGWPVKNVMGNMFHENIGLITARSNKSQQMDHFLITKFVMETKCGESTTQSSLYPLYIYDDQDGLFSNNKSDNFNSDFKQYIFDLYKKNFTPEQIISYIYSIFYSNEYRSKYLEFLRLDFPKIPFVDDIKIFSKLSSLGKELIDVHLMDKIPEIKSGQFKGEGSYIVDNINFKETENKLYINSEQYFEKVSSEIFEFSIGGYHVLDKFLKYRKNRNLSLDEIEHIESVIKIIIFTIKQMTKIDNIVKKFI